MNACLDNFWQDPFFIIVDLSCSYFHRLPRLNALDGHGKRQGEFFLPRLLRSELRPGAGMGQIADFEKSAILERGWISIL
jgi:hypothetical protein